MLAIQEMEKLAEYIRTPSKHNKAMMVPSIRLSSIPPSVWGKAFWRYLFLVALSSPEVADAAQRRKLKRHLLEFTDLIPCASCQQHFRQRLARDPAMRFLAGRDTFFRWIYDAREAVSRRAGKPVVSLESTIRSETRRSCKAVVSAYANRVWASLPRYVRTTRKHADEYEPVPPSEVTAHRKLISSHLKGIRDICPQATS